MLHTQCLAHREHWMLKTLLFSLSYKRPKLYRSDLNKSIPDSNKHKEKNVLRVSLSSSDGQGQVGTTRIQGPCSSRPLFQDNGHRIRPKPWTSNLANPHHSLFPLLLFTSSVSSIRAFGRSAWLPDVTSRTLPDHSRCPDKRSNGFYFHFRFPSQNRNKGRGPEKLSA